MHAELLECRDVRCWRPQQICEEIVVDVNEELAQVSIQLRVPQRLSRCLHHVVHHDVSLREVGIELGLAGFVLFVEETQGRL